MRGCPPAPQQIKPGRRGTVRAFFMIGREGFGVPGKAEGRMPPAAKGTFVPLESLIASRVYLAVLARHTQPNLPVPGTST